VEKRVMTARCLYSGAVDQAEVLSRLRRNRSLSFFQIDVLFFGVDPVILEYLEESTGNDRRITLVTFP
jgi:hypothetical protein